MNSNTLKQAIRRVISLTMATALFTAFAVSVLANEYDIGDGDITVSAGNGGYSYYVANGGGVDPNTDEITITGDTDENTLNVQTSAVITLKDVYIGGFDSTTPAITVENGSEVDFIVEGYNVIEGGMDDDGNGQPALAVNGDSKVTIEITEDGKLDGEGGYGNDYPDEAGAFIGTTDGSQNSSAVIKNNNGNSIDSAYLGGGQEYIMSWQEAMAQGVICDTMYNENAVDVNTTVETGVICVIGREPTTEKITVPEGKEAAVIVCQQSEYGDSYDLYIIIPGATEPQLIETSDNLPGYSAYDAITSIQSVEFVNGTVVVNYNNSEGESATKIFGEEEKPAEEPAAEEPAAEEPAEEPAAAPAEEAKAAPADSAEYISAGGFAASFVSAVGKYVKEVEELKGGSYNETYENFKAYVEKNKLFDTTGLTSGKNLTAGQIAVVLCKAGKISYSGEEDALAQLQEKGILKNRAVDSPVPVGVAQTAIKQFVREFLAGK